MPAFVITTAQYDAFTSSMDTMLATFGRPCRLVYPGKMEQCGNCTSLPGTSRANARWRSGGPMPFQQGTLCPQCGGTGTFRVAEVEETITLKCEFNPPTDALNLNINVLQPDGLCLVKGYFTDLPKLLRAEKVILAADIEPFRRYTYVRAREPYDASEFVRGRWFYMYMKRAS